MIQKGIDSEPTTTVCLILHTKIELNLFICANFLLTYPLNLYLRPVPFLSTSFIPVPHIHTASYSAHSSLHRHHYYLHTHIHTHTHTSSFSCPHPLQFLFLFPITKGKIFSDERPLPFAFLSAFAFSEYT